MPENPVEVLRKRTRSIDPTSPVDLEGGWIQHARPGPFGRTRVPFAWRQFGTTGQVHFHLMPLLWQLGKNLGYGRQSEWKHQWYALWNKLSRHLEAFKDKHLTTVLWVSDFTYSPLGYFDPKQMMMSTGSPKVQRIGSDLRLPEMDRSLRRFLDTGKPRREQLIWKKPEHDPRRAYPFHRYRDWHFRSLDTPSDEEATESARFWMPLEHIAWTTDDAADQMFIGRGGYPAFRRQDGLRFHGQYNHLEFMDFILIGVGVLLDWDCRVMPNTPMDFLGITLERDSAELITISKFKCDFAAAWLKLGRDRDSMERHMLSWRPKAS